jgi:hypothetical protein
VSLLPPPLADPAVTRCDCGHMATPDGLATGYAVDTETGKTVCYTCAAQRDIDYSATMQAGDPPLFAYIKGDLPEPQQRALVQITTWPGVVIGAGHVYRGARSDNQMRVVARINGRTFWGRTPTRNGNYTRLRPYRKEPR